MKKFQPEMPMLKAYRRGEITAQTAIFRAAYYDEALEIIRAANSRAEFGEAHPNAPGVQ